MPAKAVYPNGEVFDVTEGDYTKKVYYDPDTQRLQMREVRMRWCAEDALSISWTW